MRRTMIVITFLSTVSASCGGRPPHEPYDVVAGPARSAVGASVAEAPEAESAGWDVHVPWAIALLTDTPPRTRAADRTALGVTASAPGAPAVETIAREQQTEEAEDSGFHVVHADKHVQAKPVANDKPALPKVCPSTLDRRS